jgi:hypothetical protein
MIDPITAVAMATSAFKTVQKMVAMGRDVEDTFGQMGSGTQPCQISTKLNAEH